MKEMVIDMLYKEFFYVFTDEFIARNKEYYDFLLKDNLSFLLNSIATWIFLGLSYLLFT